MEEVEEAEEAEEVGVKVVAEDSCEASPYEVLSFMPRLWKMISRDVTGEKIAG